MLETDEATGTAETGLYFRMCVRNAFVDLGCTPYFIGPIPWLPIQEEGVLFLGQVKVSSGFAGGYFYFWGHYTVLVEELLAQRALRQGPVERRSGYFRSLTRSTVDRSAAGAEVTRIRT